jgi:lysophospholipase L1-like esterase
MKEILCFGDSNTWGWDPQTKERYARDKRWPGVLQNTLGAGYHVIEEGQNGRTTVWDDPVEGSKNGRAYFIPCLETHAPLDLVIIMLGTNDLKYRFSVTAYDIAQGAGTLVDIVKKSDSGRMGKPPRVLLMVPPPLGRLDEYAETFEGGPEKSKRLSGRYRDVSKELECGFFDTSTVMRSSDIDGIHLEEDAHVTLGKAVAAVVKRILS